MDWTLTIQIACITTSLLTIVGAIGIGLVMAGKAPKWLADTDEKGIEKWNGAQIVGGELDADID